MFSLLFSHKIICNLHEFTKLFEGTSLSFSVGGGFNARLLGKNRYKINNFAIEGLLLNEVVVSFCGSLLTPPC